MSIVDKRCKSPGKREVKQSLMINNVQLKINWMTGNRDELMQSGDRTSGSFRRTRKGSPSMEDGKRQSCLVEGLARIRPRSSWQNASIQLPFPLEAE